MISCRFALPCLAFAVAAILPARAAAPVPSLQSYGQYGQQGGWDVPPSYFNDIQRRGYHDGVEGARHDYGNHRTPDPNNRDEYRSPSNVSGADRDAYRAAFAQGYNTAAPHLWGTGAAPAAQAPAYPSSYPPPQAQAPYGGYQANRANNGAYGANGNQWGSRGLQSDAQRQGYREGMDEARKDYQFHRPSNPEGHEEYQNPYVDPQHVDEYREGFMRGYEVGWSQVSGQYSGGQASAQTAWQNTTDPNQMNAPDAFTDIQRRGFKDGITGAQRDFGNHRRPDPHNRDEYRSPSVSAADKDAYREGFRRGYEMAAAGLWNGTQQ